jgi:hypothetical protein
MCLRFLLSNLFLVYLIVDVDNDAFEAFFYLLELKLCC